MKRIICTAACVSSVLFMQAQTTVNGKVVDAADQHPLSGATISVNGKSLTKTGEDGSFSVECSKAPRITVSFVGYEAAQYALKNCPNDFTISLTPYSQESFG